MLCAGDTIDGWKHKDGERKECTIQVSVARMSRRDSWCGVLVSEELVDRVVEVKHMSECLMMVKLMNLISSYAPQVG